MSQRGALFPGKEQRLFSAAEGGVKQNRGRRRASTEPNAALLPRMVFGRHWLGLLAVFVASGCAGHTQPAVSPDLVNSAKPATSAPFSGSEQYSQFLLCCLGVDPSSVVMNGSSNLLVVQRALKSVGRSLKATSFDEAFRGDEGKDSGFVLLEYRDGRVQACLSSPCADGQHYVQLVNDSILPELVRIPNLKAEAIARVWRPEKRSQGNGVPVGVGSAVVKASSLWHSFGMTLPESRPAVHFSVRNEGKSTVRAEILTVSCGCVGARLNPGGRLEPNAEIQLEATLSTYDRTNIRQTITLLLSDEVQHSRKVELFLFANQLPIASIQPEAVNFGAHYRTDTPVTATVTLRPTPHDNCTIQLPFAPHILPQSVRLSPHNENGRLAFDVSLDARHMACGIYRWLLPIRTTSRFRPIIRVPISVQINPHVFVVPSVAAFGPVAVGEQQEQRLAETM